MWRTEIPEDNEITQTIGDVRVNPDQLKDILQLYRIFFVARTKSKTNKVLSLSLFSTFCSLFVLFLFSFLLTLSALFFSSHF
jgi:hypothetical protein